MPKSPRRPEQLAGKIFRGSNAVQGGLLTEDDLRSSAWQSVFRGIYADQTLVITHRMRCLAVSAYLMPEGAVIAGRSAAHLYGVPARRDGDLVEVLSPKAFGPVNGLSIHTGNVSNDDRRRSGKLFLTSPLRTCWDLARWLDTVEAVVLLDALASKRLITSSELIAYSKARSPKPGSGRLLKAAQLIDCASESPQESRLRVRLVLAGLPKPVAQFVVSKGGRFIARVDLAWPELKIAMEYDGAWHADRRQLEHDRARLNKLVGADWIVLHVTARRLQDDFDGIVQELRAAMRARRGR